MNEFKKLADEVLVWHRDTFPNATVNDICSKLDEETLELITEIDGVDTLNMAAIAGELADVQLVLIAMAGWLGIDLMEAANRKFEINKQRDWSER